MTTQLTQPIPLQTPRGPALAYLVIDPGLDHDLQWVCFLKNGESWTFRNPDIRLADNYTMGRLNHVKLE